MGDIIAVFGMLVVLMILPSLLFKSALSSKRDSDQLNPDTCTQDTPKVTAAHITPHPMMGSVNEAYTPITPPASASIEPWAYFTPEFDKAMNEDTGKHHNGHHKS